MMRMPAPTTVGSRLRSTRLLSPDRFPYIGISQRKVRSTGHVSPPATLAKGPGTAQRLYRLLPGSSSPPYPSPQWKCSTTGSRRLRS